MMLLDFTNALLILAVAALVCAMLCDIALRSIPNWISVVIGVDGCVLRWLNHELGSGLACGCTVFILTALCWRRGWLGGGDVKLLGATSVLIQPALVPGYILTVALAGGGLAIIYIILATFIPRARLRHPASLLRRLLIVECRRIRRRASLPYAAAISAGVLLTLARG